jgi:hypothetical protein
VKGCIGLVSVKVKGAAASEIEDWKRIEVVVITATHDGTFTILRHDERQRGSVDAPRMDRGCGAG